MKVSLIIILLCFVNSSFSQTANDSTAYHKDSVTINKGIFFSLEEFRQNSPSISAFTVENGHFYKYSVLLGKKEKVDIDDIWGFYDGKNLYIRFGRDFGKTVTIESVAKLILLKSIKKYENKIIGQIGRDLDNMIEQTTQNKYFYYNPGDIPEVKLPNKDEDIIDFYDLETGVRLYFDKKRNLKKTDDIIKRDPELYKEYSEFKKKPYLLYLQKYNERNKLYFYKKNDSEVSKLSFPQ